MLLLDRAVLSGSFLEALRQRKLYYVALASTWLLLAFLMSSRLGERGVGLGLGVSSWDYLLTECRAVALYLKLAVWPNPLVFDYGPVFVHRVSDVLPHAALIVVAIGCVWFAWRHRPALGFCGAWFFLVLAPTSSMIPVVLQPVAENRAYLPSVGIVAAAVAISMAAIGRRLIPVWLALAGTLALCTFQRNATYHSEVGLWQDTVAKQPQNARALSNLATAWFHGRNAEQAMKLYALAVQVDPAHPEAQNDFGYALLLAGQADAAVVHLQEAVRLRPEFAMARSNLAAAYNATKRYSEALVLAESALRLAPRLPETRYLIGESLLGLGRAAESVAFFEDQLRLQPDHANSLYLLGQAFVAVGRNADAIGALERTIRVAPAFADAYYDLGQALLRAGRTDDAIARFNECLRRNPRHEGARQKLTAIQVNRAGETKP